MQVCREGKDDGGDGGVDEVGHTHTRQGSSRAAGQQGRGWQDWQAGAGWAAAAVVRMGDPLRRRWMGNKPGKPGKHRQMIE